MARDLSQFMRQEVAATPFCPGCGHGILMGAVLRSIQGLDLDMRDMLFVSGIGCAAWIPNPNFKADSLHTLHGRAVAFATGAKVANPKLKVVVISGDGDLASIGGNHLIHAARRGIDITVICANNMIYGMTGGQVAPTTPKGNPTATTLKGNPYSPFDLCRLVKAAGGDYVARGSVTRPYELMEYLSQALSTDSFSFVEVVSPCPTQYGRRQRMDSPAAMFKAVAAQCKERNELDLSQPLPDNTLVLGEFNE
jgi:2-oxoglutarate ferredoxin oxidoreductase subunit beta